jgi:hypothetical protein
MVFAGSTFMFQKCEASAFSLTLTLSPPSHANYCSAPHISGLTSCMLLSTSITIRVDSIAHIAQLFHCGSTEHCSSNTRQPPTTRFRKVSQTPFNICTVCKLLHQAPRSDRLCRIWTEHQPYACDAPLISVHATIPPYSLTLTSSRCKSLQPPGTARI